MEDLNIYLASSKRGALRIGLALGKQGDPVTFFRNRFPDARLVENYPSNQRLVQAIQAAFLNKPFGGTIDFDFSCTPFQWQVLKTIAHIPFGETRTYGEVASMVGKPKVSMLANFSPKTSSPSTSLTHKAKSLAGSGVRYWCSSKKLWV